LKRFLYALTEEELGEILAERPVPLEVVGREEGKVVVASYEPLEDLKPCRVEEVPEDWKNWRKGFGPVEAGSFVIMPPWKVPVFINPGMAFGTGLHPTTRLCIEMMEEYIDEGDSVLDVGTGSGVLSIVAKKLGAGRVVGIDISGDAIRACRENARLVPLFRRCAIFSGIYKEEELEEFLNMLERRGLKAGRILEDQSWFCVGVGDARD